MQTNEFELKFCKICFQMTNHNDNTCQKCDMKLRYDYILKQSSWEGHDWLSEPFTIKDKVMATDSHVLVITDKHRTNSNYKPLSDENAEKIIKILPEEKLNIKISIKQLEDALAALVKEEIFTVNSIECDECEGDGIVVWEYKRYEKEFDCPKCEGDGYLNTKKIPTGKFGYSSSSQYVKLYQSYLDPNFIQDIIEYSVMLHVDHIFLVAQASAVKPSLFKIGDLNYLVMPKSFHWDSNPNSHVSEVKIDEKD